MRITPITWGMLMRNSPSRVGHAHENGWGMLVGNDTLCMKHVEELQTHSQGGMRYSCDHSMPRPPKLVATSGQP